MTPWKEDMLIMAAMEILFFLRCYAADHPSKNMAIAGDSLEIAVTAMKTITEREWTEETKDD